MFFRLELRSRTRNLLLLAGVFISSFGVASCFRGGEMDALPDGDEAPVQDESPSSPTLYLGWYAESNPPNGTDPTSGFFRASLSSSDGPFSANLLFSYAGCNPASVDEGLVTGSRDGDNLSGTWSGTVDAVNINGTFNGSFDVGNDYFDGTWITSNTDHAEGKIVDCGGGFQYFVAGNGTWRAWAAGAGSMNLSVDTEVSPIEFTWNRTAEHAYLLAVLDYACLRENSGSFATCLLWEVVVRSGPAGGDTTIAYGADDLEGPPQIVRVQPASGFAAPDLTPGTQYVAVVLHGNPIDLVPGVPGDHEGEIGDPQAFRSVIFTP